MIKNGRRLHVPKIFRVPLVYIQYTYNHDCVRSTPCNNIPHFEREEVARPKFGLVIAHPVVGTLTEGRKKQPSQYNGFTVIDYFKWA
jgi:hypothetical protein